MSQAILQKNFSKVEKLLKQGAKVNELDCNHRTPLMNAIIANDIEILKLVLKYKPALETQDADYDTGETALIYATAINLDFIPILLEAGANPNVLSRHRDFSPLIKSVKADRLDLVRKLMDHGADINLKDSRNVSAFFHSLCSIEDMPWCGQHLEIFEFFLQFKPNPNFQLYGTGNTMLHMAYQYNDLKSAEKVLALNPNLNLGDWRLRQTVLHLAITEMNLPWVELLVNKGMSVCVGNVSEYTPLMYAIYGQYPEAILEIMIKGCAGKLNKANIYGEVAAHFAALKGNYAATKALIAAGVDLNLKDYKGETPLAIAKQNNHADVAKLIQDNGGI